MSLERNIRRAVVSAAPAGTLLVEPAHAHSFVQAPALPMPFWLYAWAASAVLVASFLLIAALAFAPRRAKSAQTPFGQRRWPWRGTVPGLGVLRLFSVAGLVLCMATGWLGTPQPYDNFSMSFFWIVFVLGFAYVTALFGDLYRLINPWRVMSAALDRLWPSRQGRLAQPPPGQGLWLALLLYGGFITLELFGPASPRWLAAVLGVYTLLNLVGARWVGARRWYAEFEFFAVFFDLLGRLSVVRWSLRRGRLHWRLRWPLQAARAPAPAAAAVLFILFMLSSTAFDGLADTLLWHRWYWVELYNAGLRDLFGHNPLAAFPQLRQWFFAWNVVWLWLSPALYFGAYGLAVWLAWWLCGRPGSRRKLLQAFAPPLLPIALGYHVSHYYSLLHTQGIKIISLVSDPFGFGWNLFGTADWLQQTIIPDPVIVWHVQAILILLGHIAGAWLSHHAAYRLLRSPRLALLSQLPLLVLMIAFTVAGLWILSLPLAR